MGNLQNRFRQGGNEGQAEYAYQGNRAGLYFGDHFVMGGEQFAALDPEAFLFGEMADLNYLSQVPGAIRVPTNFAHTNASRCLFYTHKESLKLVQHAEGGGEGEGAAAETTDDYHLEFAFDADAPCTVQVFFLCDETVSHDGTVTVDAKHVMPPKRFDAGLGQVYCFPKETVSLGGVPDSQLQFELGSSTYPLVISVCSTEHGPHHVLHTYCAFRRSDSGSLAVRQLVQKATVNGLCLVLKEIFGIEREADGDGAEPASPEPNDFDDDNTECVVCMSSPKDTMVLPCRHMCLCNPCAEVLRFETNKCPICRADYHSLLQIRVLQPQAEGDEEGEGNGHNDDEDDDGDDDVVNPPGFGSVALSMAVSSAAASRYGTARDPAAAADFAERAERGALEPPAGGGGGGGGDADGQYLSVVGVERPDDEGGAAAAAAAADKE